MEIKGLRRYRDQAGTACQAGLAIGHKVSKARGVALLDRISAASEPWNNEPSRYYSKCQELAARRSEKLGFRAWCVTVNILTARRSLTNL